MKHNEENCKGKDGMKTDHNKTQRKAIPDPGQLMEPDLNAGMDLLDENLLQKYLDRRISACPELNNYSRDELSCRLGFVKDGHPTKAGLLLFGIYPQLGKPQWNIAAASYPCTEKGESWNGYRFIDYQTIDGTLDEMLEKAMWFLKRNLRNTIAFSGAKRIDDLEVPVLVLREALFNSMVHRCYDGCGSSIHISLDVYPDRIEIWNPVYRDAADDHASNPQFKEACDFLVGKDSRAEGIPGMIELMKKAGLKEPEFKMENGCFHVTLYRNWPGTLFLTETGTADS